jgi:carboxypeptidase C (cathepsin A)
MKDIIIYNSNNVSVLEKFCLVLFNDTHIIKTFPLQTVLVQTVDLHNVESLNIYDNIDELTVKTKDKTTVYLELKELLKHLISEKKSPTVENNLTVDTQYIDEINTKLNNINLNLNNNILDINNMKNSSNDILSDLNKFKFDILNQISSNTINPNLSVASINPNLPVTSNNSYQSQTNDVPLSETYNNIITRNNFNRLKRMAIHKII